MLKTCKRKVLGALQSAGLLDAVASSRWRQRRLLILCYHGIAIHDERDWNSELYISADELAQRLELVRKNDVNVLPLGEGLRRLRDGTLPPRSVAITVDDGGYDCYLRAWPVLQRFDCPFTVYLTTHYCGYDRPLFPLICYYLLWKGQSRPFNGRGLAGLDDSEVELADPVARRALELRILRYVADHDLSSDAKDELSRQMAERLAVDYDDIVKRRLFQLMNPDEVREMSAAGVDFQLHTHRHRTPLDRDLFTREIVENRDRIYSFTGIRPSHFCYPCGMYRPEFLPWLEAEGVASATTCEPGMAAPGTHPLLLPRLVDHPLLAPVEFEAWLSGAAGFLPRRQRAAGGGNAGQTIL